MSFVVKDNIHGIRNQHIMIGAAQGSRHLDVGLLGERET
jgi:hypothetical protein